MIDRPKSDPLLSETGAEGQLARKISQARRVILAERIWPRVWLPLGVAGVFVLISLFGLWQWLPRDVHQALLWAFAIAFAVSLVPLIRVRAPTHEEALRRLEARSGVPHRPASAFKDTLAGEPAGAALLLWRAHRRRLAALVGRLRPGAPHPRTDTYDPFALRAALILLLAVAVLAHRNELGPRLRAAFTLAPSVPSAELRVDAWITPPVYTRLPPVMLASGPLAAVSRDGGEKVWEVPEGSELSIRVNNAPADTLTLHVAADGKQETVQPEPPSDAAVGANIATFKRTLKWSSRIELAHRGAVAAAWLVNVTADEAPAIAFTQPVSVTPRKALELNYRIEDDYGVQSARALIRRVDKDGNRLAEEGPWKPPEFALTLPHPNRKTLETQTFKDLTAHPWAGLPVEMTLEALDQAGQRGYSGAQKFVLPEREFTKPLARAVIEQRRELVAHPFETRKVVRMLDALTLAPEQFIDDKTVYLALRSAYWRLNYDRSIDSVKSVVDQLWKVALRIEDGDLPDAEEELRAAQERLMKALENKASNEDIKRLFDELRSALNRFLRAMAQRSGEMPEKLSEQVLGMNRTISPEELDQILRNIEDLARTGSREAARQMLSQLRELLENLQRGQPESMQRAEQMMDMLGELGELIRKQQQLLDETFQVQRQGAEGERGEAQREGPMSSRQGQRGQRGRRGAQGRGEKGQPGTPGPYSGLAQRQESLREMLEQMLDEMRGLGAGTPGKLGDASGAMGEAGKALREQQGDRATQQQMLALDRLRKGARSLAEQALQQLGQGQQGRMGQRGRDPLGRPMPTQGPDTGDTVKVPDEIAIQRAREILQELRRRLGDPSRPPIELDYIERLIRRF